MKTRWLSSRQLLELAETTPDNDWVNDLLIDNDYDVDSDGDGPWWRAVENRVRRETGSVTRDGHLESIYQQWWGPRHEDSQDEP